ncbi:MAG: RimK/LysX family protein [Bacteroidota bacterium]|nr:RimK/LysX family protein [Bacteroidota bacterium]MDP3146288.1 RimK/LysX family protein [Bacteroidota bacterium]MDP3556394.1 RimK/LysX family protein [Bacteroidota bacterium]
MLNKKNVIKLIGRREFVDFPLLGVFNIEAKIDSGAYTSSIHCSEIYIKEENNKSILCFVVFAEPKNQNLQCFDEFYLKKIKNSFGEIEERYVIKTNIKIGGKTIKTTVSLSDRVNMRYDVLIGRKLLKGKFIIDVNQIHTGGKQLPEEILNSTLIK